MSNQVVAKTILSQMGGIRRLQLMTGAKDFVAGEDRVHFRIGKGAKNKINSVVIQLTDMDDYVVTFNRIWGTKITEVSKHEGIYCDMLVDLFETETGFFLSF